MTDKISRRNAMVLRLGATATPAWSLPVGGEIDTTTQGVNVKLMWLQRYDYQGWGVAVPDFENRGTYWRPGMVLPWKTVPLSEYLNELEEYFELRSKT